MGCRSKASFDIACVNHRAAAMVKQTAPGKGVPHDDSGGDGEQPDLELATQVVACEPNDS